MKTLCLTLALLLACVCPAGEKSDAVSLKAKLLRYKQEKIKVDLEEKSSVEVDLPKAIGEPLKWVSKNVETWRGWCLTGYAWGKLNFRKVQTVTTSVFIAKDGTLKRKRRFGKNRYYVTRRWWKIGAITGTLEAGRKYNIDNDAWRDFQDWERQIERETAFGFVFVAEF